METHFNNSNLIAPESQVLSKDEDLALSNETVLFTFEWDKGGKRVFLSGSFMGRKNTILMEKDKKGIFKSKISLLKGSYYFRFFVDKEWKISEKYHISIINNEKYNFIDIENKGKENICNNSINSNDNKNNSLNKSKVNNQIENKNIKINEHIKNDNKGGSLIINVNNDSNNESSYFNNSELRKAHDNQREAGFSDLSPDCDLGDLSKSFDFIEDNVKDILKGFKYIVRNNKRIKNGLYFLSSDNNNADYEYIKIKIENNFMNYKFKNESQKILRDNFIELSNFINKIEKKMREYEESFEIELELNFKENNKKNNDKYINIDCEYKINILDLKMSSEVLKDENILNNKDYINFNKLLYEKVEIFKSKSEIGVDLSSISVKSIKDFLENIKNEQKKIRINFKQKLIESRNNPEDIYNYELENINKFKQKEKSFNKPLPKFLLFKHKNEEIPFFYKRNSKFYVKNFNCTFSRKHLDFSEKKQKTINLIQIQIQNRMQIPSKTERQKKTLKNKNKKVEINKLFKFNFSNNEEKILYSGDYLYEIYSNLLNDEKELFYKPNKSYMKKLEDINEQHRAILIDWLIEVHYGFGLKNETLYQTVWIIDTYLSLSKSQIVRKKLQLLGVASLLMSCKSQEIYYPKLDDLINITDNAYSKQELIEMEHNVLKELNFNIMSPTSNIFFNIIAKAFNFDKKQFFSGKYFLESSLLDYQMIKYSSSVIAASCAYIIMKFFGIHDYQCLYSNDVIKEKCPQEKIKEAVIELCLFVKNLSKSDLKAVKDKYSLPKFHSVAQYCETNVKSLKI